MNSTSRRIVSWVLQALSLASLAQWAAAGEPELQRGLRALFDSAEQSTAAAVTSARSQFEQLKRAAPSDARIDYAYGVALVNQHRYHDAVPFLARYVKTGKAEPHARCALIWAQVQDRRNLDALQQAVALAQRFPRGADVQPEGKFQDAADFLGAIIGFMESARPAAVDAQVRNESVNQVLEGLGETYIPAFDNARLAVAKRLAALRAQRDAEQQRLAAKQENQNQQAKTTLDEERKRLAAGDDVAQSSTEKLRAAQRESAQMQRELSALNEDRARLGARITTIEAAISALQTPRVDDRTFAGGTAPVRTDFLNPSDPRWLQIQALAVSLAPLNKQAFEIDRKILGYRTRIAELESSGQQEMRTLVRSDAESRESKRRAQKAERQLDRRDKLSNPRASILTEKMTTLSSYLAFPYVQERRRVLAWFSNEELRSGRMVQHKRRQPP
ncbi:MAG TPA: hypothetical protein VGX76_18070 [Pirellulales bacterium]|nr:hypothetical protein [Pirellulales bacterium]